MFDENILSISMAETLKSEFKNILCNIGELGFDSLLDNNIIKDIPLISTVSSICKIGNAIYKEYYLKKVTSFSQEIENGMVNEQKRQKYINDFLKNEKKRKGELEYILIILERYMSFDRAHFLGKIYLAYLEGEIKWIDFCKYAETIDRLLPGDYEKLALSDTHKTEKDKDTDALQRLIGLGLVIEDIRKSNIETEDNESGGQTVHIDSPAHLEKRERTYSRTEFGNTLVRIISK